MNVNSIYKKTGNIENKKKIRYGFYVGIFWTSYQNECTGRIGKSKVEVSKIN